MKTKEEILEGLSTKDEARLFAGRDDWHLEAIEGKNIALSDGPHGLRKEVHEGKVTETVKAVCYPAACLSACSFDTALMEKFGEELAKECIRNDVDVLLGPGINIKRNPLCGRNFEYFSEDPLLAGKLSAKWIEGVQKRNVGVSLKHLALNSQEEARFINSSIADEKAFREIYLKAFEIAIRESHPWTVMASYNKIDGIHSTENKRLLTDILRKDMGFDGIVMSDWGAIDDPVKSLEAGLDLEMPGISKGSSKRVLEAIERGDIDKSVLDGSTARLVDLYIKTMGEKTDDFSEEHALSVAREIAEKSFVLLKNDDHILPLREDTDLLIVGDFAEHPRYQGGGSSEINPIHNGCLLWSLMEDNIKFEYARGYQTGALEPDQKLIREATEKAKGKEAVLIMCGIPRELESEGYDRDGLSMPESHLALIKSIAEVNPNIIIVLQNGSPILMPFLPDVKAVLETYLGGSMHAEAIKNTIYGRVNPSGRLAETFPLSYRDVPSFESYLKHMDYSLYKESIYVGYRYYDKAGKDVLFPFGYGLSYAETEWTEPRVWLEGDTVNAEVKIKNLSNIMTYETVQIYAGLNQEGGFRPRKELRAFSKVELQPDEEKTVTVGFPLKDLEYWSLEENCWVLRPGEYRVWISRHSYDETLYGDMKVTAGKTVAEEYPAPYGTLLREPTDKEFFSLLSHEPELERDIHPFTAESPIEDLLERPLGKIFLRPFVRHIIKSEKDPMNRKMIERAVPAQPIRSVQMMFPISKTGIEGLVDFFNGHLFEGLRKMKKNDDI